MPACPQCGNFCASGASNCSRCGAVLPELVPMPEWQSKLIGRLALLGSLGMAAWWAFLPPRNMFDPSFSLFGRWCSGLAAGGIGGAILGFMIGGAAELFAESRESKQFDRKAVAQSETRLSEPRLSETRLPFSFGAWMVRLLLIVWTAGFGFLSYRYILREPEAPLRLRGHSAGVTGVQFSGDGKRLFSTADDGTLRAWNLLDGKQLCSIAVGKQAIEQIAFSPDETAALSYRTEDRVFVHWDVATGKEIGRIKFTQPTIGILAGPAAFWSASGKRAVFGPVENKLVVWDLDADRLVHRFGDQLPYAGEQRLRGVAGCLAVRSGQLDTQLWDVESGVRLAGFHGNPVAATAQARKILIWNPAARECLLLQGEGGEAPRRLARGGSIREVASLALTPNGGRALVGDKDFSFFPMRLWDLERGVELARYRLDCQNADCLAVSPDGRWFAAGTRTGQILVWKALVP